jgi:hypothetical protein
MGGADDYRFMVGEQDGRTVGGENPEQQVGRVRDHRVGTRPFVLRPGFGREDHLRRMDLVDGYQLGVRVERGDGQPAVAGNCLAVIVAAEADVETGALADGNTSPAAEEAVGEPAEANGADDLDSTHSSFRMMMSSSA